MYNGRNVCWLAWARFTGQRNKTTRVGPKWLWTQAHSRFYSKYAVWIIIDRYIIWPSKGEGTQNETLRYAIMESGWPWGGGGRTKARLNPLLNRDEWLWYDHIEITSSPAQDHSDQLISNKGGKRRKNSICGQIFYLFSWDNMAAEW